MACLWCGGWAQTSALCNSAPGPSPRVLIPSECLGYWLCGPHISGPASALLGGPPLPPSTSGWDLPSKATDVFMYQRGPVGGCSAKEGSLKLTPHDSGHPPDLGVGFAADSNATSYSILTILYSSLQLIKEQMSTWRLEGAGIQCLDFTDWFGQVRCAGWGVALVGSLYCLSFLGSGKEGYMPWSRNPDRYLRFS